jgi:hypothetical protein
VQRLCSALGERRRLGCCHVTYNEHVYDRSRQSARKEVEQARRRWRRVGRTWEEGGCGSHRSACLEGGIEQAVEDGTCVILNLQVCTSRRVQGQEEKPGRVLASQRSQDVSGSCNGLRVDATARTF